MIKKYNIVFDVGKKHAKIILLEKNSKILKIIKTKYPLIKIEKKFYLKNIIFLTSWFKKNLFLINKKFLIENIVTTGHGAAIGLIGKNNKPLFGVMDYENDFESINKKFDLIKPNYKNCLTPDSDKGLSLAKQIFYLKIKRKRIFNQIKHIVTLPQYISWLFSKKAFSEISYIGNHTHLWDYNKDTFSSYVNKMKIKKKIPKIKKAWDKVGHYLLDKRLINQKINILNGIHDSDASYLLFLKSKVKRFNLIASGTHFVIMNSFTSTSCLDANNDMYSGLDVYGNKVPTIRFMGGREYEFLIKKLKIKKKKNNFDYDYFKRENFLYPSYGIGGPFGHMKGNYISLKNKSDKEKYMAIVTYITFVTNYCLELINSKDNIIISGPLINNNDFLKTLNSLRPKQKIYLSSNQETTAIGASLLCDIKKKINTKLKIYRYKKIDNTITAYKKWLLNLNN